MLSCSRLLARAAFLLSCLLAASLAWGQSCSIPGQAGAATINAQPNSFFAGTGSPAAGANAIAVSAGSGVVRDIQPGDMLLVIQMQGADIDSTDTNAYGDGVSHAVTTTVAFGANGYAGGTNGTNFVAGNYEWTIATNTVSHAGGGTINLHRGLSNSYFTRAGNSTQGKQSFQVVRVPQYSNLTLNGGLTVQPWNGATGGILVLDAAGDINLAGQTINGAGRGFRGAAGVEVGPQCTAAPDPIGCLEYRGLIAGQRGGSKGEGLVGTPARLYNNDPAGTGGGTVVAGAADGYINGDLMRGAPGNAGGGGNQHNAGGGGGGNGGAGGRGGNSWNNSQVAYAGTFVGGFGGAPTANSATRWIMGGGGGAGDVGGNGLTQPDASGGAGGALVVLRASRIVSGGATINVNGAPGQRSRATDAGGGGGAGGTVVLGAGTGGLNGALTVNANGGGGGAYQVVDNEQDGAGGGGGGGVLISNVAGTTFSSTAGAAGASSSNACPPFRPAANCGQAAGAGGATAGYAIVSPGVQVGYECLPNITVTKSTTTPVVTTQAGATAGYVISVVNTGGGARFVDLFDSNLPPGWTLAPSGTADYFPTQPLAAGRLSTGGETIATATSSTWSVAAGPLVVPAPGVNQLTISSFAIAPVTNGVPGAMTFTFIASIPDTATVGTYHNGLGFDFLDPTRAAASTRQVSAAANISANRTTTAYSANTTYNNYNGAGVTAVSGSNYDGTATGPAGEDVRLVPDFSITKTGSTSAALSATFTYTLTPRNNGRPIATQTFSVTQATTVAAANVGSTLGSSPLTVTDTLPAGITLTTPFTGTGWVCSALGTSTPVCTRTDANAYPAAASTNFPALTATARVTCAVSASRVNTTTISVGAGETTTANNTATLTTTSPPCANLTVTKANAGTTLGAGSTTSYTITIANLGPSAAPGTIVTDPATPGLNCTAISCGVAGAASCPAPLTVAALQSGGLNITPSFASGSTVTLTLTCGVTATGQ
jgi:uncharacterized repeat protein (TIGR01451 family)